MRIIRRVIRGCWFYFWGHILALFFYDRKYLRGKWFSGKLGGLCSIGWEWVVHDALARIRTHENKEAKFPISPMCRAISPENIIFDPDDLNNFQSFGIYYQALGPIKIGKGSYIGPNVGLITSNHDVRDPENHMQPEGITLGEKCWIGMNSVILEGVVLGPHTTVGAGSVVTKSFPDGYCIVAGNPAHVIREIKELESNEDCNSCWG